MSIKIRSKHSSVANKAPLPADLVEGEIALNINSASPAAYIKDSAGAIVKLAGVGSVSTPDATDAVKGVVELATATETVDGVDTTRAVTPAGLKSALGAQAGSSTAPASPVVGQVWVDNSTSPSVVKVWGGTPAAWIPQVGGTVTGTTAPTTPVAGTIWVDTSATPNVVKIWDGTAWVTAAPDGSAAAAIANDAKYATKAEMPWVRTGTNTVLANAGDRVGLGTSTPGAVLESKTVNVQPGDAAYAKKAVIANIPFSTSNITSSAVAIYDGTTHAADIGYSYDGTGYYLTFGTNDNTVGAPIESMRIDRSGRVGIGTTAGTGILNAKAGTNANLVVDNLGGGGGALRISALNDAISANTDFQLQASNLFFATGGSEKARLTSDGKFLVGTSTSFGGGYGAANLQVSGPLNGDPAEISLRRNYAGLNASGMGAIAFYSPEGRVAQISGSTNGTQTAGTSSPGALVFSTTADGSATPVERMRITQNGNVCIGTTSADARFAIEAYTNGDRFGIAMRPSADNATPIVFRNAAGIDVGKVTTTSSATAYVTSSDYRLKENVIPLTGAAARVKQLKPSQFNFIVDPGRTVDGFIAHEAQAVVPECVTGTKDEVDADGNPIYQGIDQSKLVPLLTAALQEALAEIESLKARVTALEP